MRWLATTPPSGVDFRIFKKTHRIVVPRSIPHYTHLVHALEFRLGSYAYVTQSNCAMNCVDILDFGGFVLQIFLFFYLRTIYSIVLVSIGRFFYRLANQLAGLSSGQTSGPFVNSPR